MATIADAPNVRIPTGEVEMDLSAASVHVPSAERPKNMADISTEKRDAMPETQFAWPEQRKYPIHDAAHCRNAAARLAQAVKAGRVSKSTAAKIHKRIVAAGKKFGVEVTPMSEEAAGVGAGIHPGPLKARRHLTRGRVEISIDHPQHGRFEIRHMTDRSTTLRQTVNLDSASGDGDGPKWVQISTRGTFAGHGAGKFSLDDRTFSDIVRNFHDVDGGQVAFDYEHASEADGTSGTVPVHGAPAQGWIKDLRVEPDGLHALVDFLEPAKTQIREGKYRFVSPAIRFGAIHPVTGKPIGARLTSVALTNQPFLRGLKPLAAKDSPNHPNDELLGKSRPMSERTLCYSTHEFMPKIRACLGMHELSTPMECAERMKSLRDLHESGGGGMASGVAVNEYVDRLRDEMRMPMTSTVESMFDAVQEMIDAAIAEHEAEFHPGQVAASDDDVGGGGGDVGTMTDDGDTMSDMKMKDITTKLSAIEADNAKLTLQLNEKQSKLEASEAEVIKLRADGEARDAKELEERVQEAFATHKDAQKLTDTHLKMMRVTCKADRAAFEEVYPRVSPDKRHLMRNLTGGGKDVPGSTGLASNVPGDISVQQESTSETTARLMKDDPKLTMEDAQNLAVRLHSGR